MENIINWVILIASFLTAITTICMFCRKAINKGFEPIYGRIDKIDENQCRNFLVDFLADVEKGIEKRIKSLCPQMNILSLDFDSSVSDVNITNRLLLFIDNINN